WRYCEGSVWKSIRRLPLLNLRSASAMVLTLTSFCRTSGEIALMVIAKEMVGEIGDRAQRRLRCLAVRRVPRVRQQRNLDRGVAFLLGHLDLPQRAVLVVFALDDQHRHPDVGECVADIPGAELGIEPRTAPAVEGVVRIRVYAGELRTQRTTLECSL